jgi:hypothetical protein
MKLFALGKPIAAALLTVMLACGASGQLALTARTGQ